MAQDKIFVGRKDELEQFKTVLNTPQGQAVLVVGNRGMGKTWLINKMAEIAENHPGLKCGCVRYEVTPTDSVGSTMALMMDDAYEAGRSLKEGIKVTGRNKGMWKALISVAEVIGGTRAKALGELVLSFQRDKAKSTRVQFLDALTVLSKRLVENARAVLIIDPEKYMQERSASDWRIVVKQLPEKIKFIFAQRTEDELVKSKTFTALDNVMLIPQDHLCSLTETEVQELVRLRARGVGQSGKVLRDAVERYKGHPYAIQAALDIVKKRKSVGELPQDPTTEAIAETQWEEVCKVGADAISLFEAYAILEVGVADNVVEAVSGLNSTARKRLQKDSYLRGLLRYEGEGKRIYHVILADYIIEQISEAEKKKYHGRVVEVYKGRLRDIDFSKAIRLLESMKTAGVARDVVIYSALINKSPDYETAKNWFKIMREENIQPNVTTYSTLINKSPDYETAKNWFEMMRREEIQTNVFSYSALFSKNLSGVSADEILTWFLAQEYHPEKAIEAAIAGYTRICRIDQTLFLVLHYPHLPAALKVIRNYPNETLEYFKGLFDSNNDHPNAAYALGVAFLELEQPKNARLYLNKAIELSTHPARRERIRKWLSGLDEI